MNSNNEFRQGWRVVLAALIGVGLGLSPIPFYEIALFAPELAKEFGWGIGDVMGGIIFMMIGVLIASPLVGSLADRYGVRRVTFGSMICFSIGLALFTVQNGSLTLYYGTWLLMAMAGSGTLPITWTRVLNQWFDTHKGLAFGIALTGTGLSGFVLKPATAWVIAEWGWRGGFIFLAALPILIALPVAWFLFAENPHTATQIKSSNTAPIRAIEGLSFAETMRDWRFWIIGFFILPVAFAISGQIANLEIILTSRGTSRALILSTVPFLGLSVIAGRLVGGWLIDRIWAPAVTVGMLSTAALAAWLLAHGEIGFVSLLFSVIGLGLAAGVEFDILAFLTARYFGAKNYGSIYGTLFAFYAVGSGVAPYIFGRIYDATKSYDSIVTIAASLIFLPSLLLLALGKYRYAAPEKSA